MNSLRWDQVDLALGAGCYRSEPHIGITWPAAVVDSLVALQTFGAVEYAVEHPGIRMVMHAAGPPRHAYDRVDDKSIGRIHVKQQVLAAFGRRPLCRMRLDARVRHERFDQRLSLFHTASIVGLGPPYASQIGDEALEYRECI